MKTTMMFRFVVLHLILFTLLRVGFYHVFADSETLSLGLLAQSFKLGLRFDLRFTLLLLLPLLVFGWGRWSPLRSTKVMKRWTCWFTFTGALWLMFYIFDFGFYGYLNSRINSSALSFLINPDIAAGMIWQSYPVVWILLSYAVALAVLYHLLQRFVFRQFKTLFFNLPRRLLYGLFIVLFLGGLYGNFAQYPLRWSEAFFSPHHFLSHLSLNPIVYFFETYEFSAKKNYDVEKVRKSYDVVADYLGVENKNSEALNFERQVVAEPKSPRPNVIVIVMESLAMSKTNLTGNSLKPTPALDEIAQESYWFSNYFSPCEGTARNMFSIMTAIPDVTKVQTSTRNPLVVDQRLIINAYQGYRKMYFLGGSASWANIRGIFSHNIGDIEIVEEGSFEKSRTDVWGISDLDLFIEAHQKFDKVAADQPFVAVIQTASFHRPYTIPKNAKDFKIKTPKPTDLKEAGFYSADQYNSLRFSDYSLGHFFKLAKKSKYYKNTLFVITGDHGLPDEGGVNVTPGFHQWNLEKYHVPLVLHHRGLFPQATEDPRPAGHPDLMTTVAAAAGVSHPNTTFGRNLFDPRFDQERYSFIYNYYSELGEFGLVSGDYYYHYDDVNKGQLFKYRSDSPAIDVKSEAPEIFQRMDLLGHGMFNTAHYLLFNNQKKK